MESLQTPQLPAAYVNFAKAVGSLAEAHGIKGCQIKIVPDWRDFPDGHVHGSVHGDVQINYSSKDGRGRPCVNLDVYFNAHAVFKIVTNPESSS